MFDDEVSGMTPSLREDLRIHLAELAINLKIAIIPAIPVSIITTMLWQRGVLEVLDSLTEVNAAILVGAFLISCMKILYESAQLLRTEGLGTVEEWKDISLDYLLSLVVYLLVAYVCAVAGNMLLELWAVLEWPWLDEMGVFVRLFGLVAIAFTEAMYVLRSFFGKQTRLKDFRLLLRILRQRLPTGVPDDLDATKIERGALTPSDAAGEDAPPADESSHGS